MIIIGIIGLTLTGYLKFNEMCNDDKESYEKDFCLTQLRAVYAISQTIYWCIYFVICLVIGCYLIFVCPFVFIYYKIKLCYYEFRSRQLSILKNHDDEGNPINPS